MSGGSRKPAEIDSDPFRERAARRWRWRTCVLGARFEFSSNSRDLLGLAHDAFANIPQHRLAAGGRTLRVSLERVRDGNASRATPPKPVLSSGGGLLCAHIDAGNFVIVDPAAARALVQVGDAMLRHRNLLRYELLEFAAITLATRVQGLVPLHAGCVGVDGRGLLLLGSSGSGKSTLALHAALGGLELLAEDSVFVQPATLRATALSAYVHAREDALALVEDRPVRSALARAPQIERRSGVRKREIDLRRLDVRLAARPLRIAACIVLSSRRVRGAVLEPLRGAELKRALRFEQAYALNQPGWGEFERRVLIAGGFRLNRVSPAQGVSSLRELLDARRT